MSEFQGAVLNAQWTRFDEQTTTRDRNGKYLGEKIAQIAGLYPQHRGPECTRHSYHLFAFRVVAEEFGMSPTTSSRPLWPRESRRWPAT